MVSFLLLGSLRVWKQPLFNMTTTNNSVLVGVEHSHYENWYTNVVRKCTRVYKIYVRYRTMDSNVWVPQNEMSTAAFEPLFAHGSLDLASKHAIHCTVMETRAYKWNNSHSIDDWVPRLFWLPDSAWCLHSCYVGAMGLLDVIVPPRIDKFRTFTVRACLFAESRLNMLTLSGGSYLL